MNVYLRTCVSSGIYYYIKIEITFHKSNIIFIICITNYTIEHKKIKFKLHTIPYYVLDLCYTINKQLL